MRRAFPLLLGLLPVLVLLDLGALYLGRALSLGAHALLWSALTVAATLSARPHGRRAPLAGLALFALTGLLLGDAFATSRQFYRAVGAVRPGMSRAEVADTLSRSAELSDDIFLRSGREDTESWYADPWFAVCDVVYGNDERVVDVSRFAFDSPFQNGW